MPPKPKFTREEIVKVALKLVSERGVEKLTARELGLKLGSSARPIFTVFSGMSELLGEVRLSAMKRFEEMKLKKSGNMPFFKQVGMKMVTFGIKEPKLYQLLFMQENENATSFEDIFGKLGVVATECVESIEKEYSLTSKQAKTLFEHAWIHTYGIGTLCATGACNFSIDKISRMLTEDFSAMILLLKTSDKGKKL